MSLFSFTLTEVFVEMSPNTNVTLQLEFQNNKKFYLEILYILGKAELLFIQLLGYNNNAIYKTI